VSQSKAESGVEIFFNYLSGFLIAYTIYAIVIMPTPWLKDSPFLVTTIYTLVSIVRSYLWRRFFNAGSYKWLFLKFSKYSRGRK
jgi:hypothetical protein